MRRARLVLEDGAVFEGSGFGSDDDAFGEVVFNTGMSGYQEVLTDPSYHGQIVAMTYPQIGNYGVNEQDAESSRPRVAGFVVRDVPARWSSWRAESGLEDYLRTNRVSAITEVDTRRLTRHIRDKGAMRGVISSRDAAAEELADLAASQPSMIGSDLTSLVSTQEPYEWPAPEEVRFKVAAYDFGIKYNILRLLAAHGCAVTVFPSRAPAEELLATSPDGIFLSNGPGDPAAVGHGIAAIEKLIGRVPIFGICLGHQLLAIAAGLTTYKLPFGHRGINHPVARLSDGAIEITTQNHGFAVDGAAFGIVPGRPGDPIRAGEIVSTEHGKAELTHLNLNDHTVEGFRLIDRSAFAVQYHPEAGPGPHDARYLFEMFTDLMEKG